MLLHLSGISNRVYTAAVVGAFIVTTIFAGTAACGQGTRPAASRPVAAVKPLPSDTLYFDFNRDIASQLISFDSLYLIAAAYSPAVKSQGELAVAQDANYRLAKVVVLRNVAPFINYSNGNQVLLTNGVSTLSPTVNDNLNQISNGYRYGIGVQLPLDELFGRPQRIRQAQAQYRASLHQRDQIALQVKRDLITVYQDLLTSQRVLKVRMRDEQTLLASLRIAEVESQQGKIGPDELATASTRYAQTKSLGEVAKGEFLKNLYYLEALVGVPLEQLKRN